MPLVSCSWKGLFTERYGAFECLAEQKTGQWRELFKAVEDNARQALTGRAFDFWGHLHQADATESIIYTFDWRLLLTAVPERKTTSLSSLFGNLSASSPTNKPLSSPTTSSSASAESSKESSEQQLDPHYDFAYKRPPVRLQGKLTFRLETTTLDFAQRFKVPRVSHRTHDSCALYSPRLFCRGRMAANWLMQHLIVRVACSQCRGEHSQSTACFRTESHLSNVCWRALLLCLVFVSAVLLLSACCFCSVCSSTLLSSACCLLPCMLLL